MYDNLENPIVMLTLSHH